MVKARDHILCVFGELSARGFSSEQPFCISRNLKDIKQYAMTHGVTIAGGGLYTSPRALSHMTRAIKVKNGIAVPAERIASFPESFQSMDLYFDQSAGLFVYVDEESTTKYVIHPFYSAQVRGRKKRLIMFLTASKLKSTENFHRDQTRYVRIQKKSAGD